MTNTRIGGEERGGGGWFGACFLTGAVNNPEEGPQALLQILVPLPIGPLIVQFARFSNC